MTNGEKQELLLLGFDEQEIKDIEKARKVAVKDMKSNSKNTTDAEKNRTDN